MIEQQELKILAKCFDMKGINHSTNIKLNQENEIVEEFRASFIWFIKTNYFGSQSSIVGAVHTNLWTKGILLVPAVGNDYSDKKYLGSFPLKAVDIPLEKDLVFQSLKCVDLTFGNSRKKMGVFRRKDFHLYSSSLKCLTQLYVDDP